MLSENIHWVDILLFFLVLLFSLLIGIYFSIKDRKKQTTTDYLMGGRNLQMFPTFVSLHMSNLSAMIILMITSDTYTRGSPYVWYFVGTAMANVFVVVYIVPIVYKLKLISINEYLERRFSSKMIRKVGSVFGLVQQSLYMGIAVFAPATALEAVIGVPLWILVVINCTIGTIYTAIGGMKAVIWTDVFQGGVMYLGLIVILIKGCMKIGGFGVAFDIAKENGRVSYDRFELDTTKTYTATSFVMSELIEWIQYFAFVQATVQRYCAVNTLRNSRLTVALNIPATGFLILLLTLCGIMIYAHYMIIGCGPFESGQVSTVNQVFPHYILNELAIPGLTGIFFASLFSGCLSTLSSGLSGLCAICWEDLIKDHRRVASLPPNKQTMINKGLVVIFGIFSGLLAMGASAVPGSISQVGFLFLGAGGAITSATFLLGLFVRKADWKAALSGIIIGSAFMLFMIVGSMSIQRDSNYLAPVHTHNCPGFNTTMSNITAPPAMELHVNGSIHYTHVNFTEATKPDDIPPTHTGLNRLFATSYEWYYPLGCFVTFVSGVIATIIITLLKGTDEDLENNKELDDLVVPLNKIFCWLRHPKCAPRDDYHIAKSDDEKHIPLEEYKVPLNGNGHEMKHRV